MHQVRALVFDVFGTVVDWRSSMIEALKGIGANVGLEGGAVDWASFVQSWRAEYLTETRRISASGTGPFNVDLLHSAILEDLLGRPEWSLLASKLDEEGRRRLVVGWHLLKGWPDSVPGLLDLKKDNIITTLSNGNLKLLIDMAKFAGLPWDTIISTELFNTYKPAPKAYLSTIALLNLPPSACAMVAAHVFDLCAAAAVGMRTIYVRREKEDSFDPKAVKSKSQGGEFDLVVDSIEEIAGHLRLARETAG